LQSFWHRACRLRPATPSHRRSTKRIVVFPKPNALPLKFTFYEVMAVDVLRGLKGKKSGDAHHHRAERFIPDVEVEVSKS
jgi:hypothetical protein